jgi:hypothetical protein
MIVLNEEQRRAVLNGEVVRVAAPELGEDVVLLRADAYEQVREALDDDRLQKAVLAYSMKQAALVAREGLE